MPQFAGAYVLVPDDSEVNQEVACEALNTALKRRAVFASTSSKAKPKRPRSLPDGPCCGRRCGGLARRGNECGSAQAFFRKLAECIDCYFAANTLQGLDDVIESEAVSSKRSRNLVASVRRSSACSLPLA